MASLIYNCFPDYVNRGAIDCDTDTIKAMLVSGSYTPDKDAHVFRSNIGNEITGAGYTAGGNTVPVTVTKDTANDRTTVTFQSVAWPTSTITARGCVYYKSRGGSANLDELIAYNDFGSNVSSSGTTFLVGTASIIFQN